MFTNASKNFIVYESKLGEKVYISKAMRTDKEYKVRDYDSCKILASYPLLRDVKTWVKVHY